MKVTAIDPFSVKETRAKPEAAKGKPKVEAPAEAKLDPVKKDGAGGKLYDIIEEARKRAQKRNQSTDRRKRRALAAYALVLNGERTLHEKGQKFDRVK
ncbi:MAG TPA: hypothetical protein VFV50_17975 [Bdellovibrionales bacterium]|nr:hypothetical protein [Bdellovibrionales bacterium]